VIAEAIAIFIERTAAVEYGTGADGDGLRGPRLGNGGDIALRRYQHSDVVGPDQGPIAVQELECVRPRQQGDDRGLHRR